MAAAYADWTADQDSLIDTGRANSVTGAIRNLVMGFLGSNPAVEYLVIAGDDRVIPFRRVPEGNLTTTEHQFRGKMVVH